MKKFINRITSLFSSNSPQDAKNSVCEVTYAKPDKSDAFLSKPIDVFDIVFSSLLLIKMLFPCLGSAVIISIVFSDGYFILSSDSIVKIYL